VGHGNLAYDGPTSAIVLHALSHNGRVRLGKINRSACDDPLMPGVHQAKVNAVLAQYNAILATALGPDGPHSRGEPPLACYVPANCRKSG